MRNLKMRLGYNFYLFLVIIFAFILWYVNVIVHIIIIIKGSYYLNDLKTLQYLYDCLGK